MSAAASRSRRASASRTKREELVAAKRAAPIMQRIGDADASVKRVIAKNIAGSVSAVEVRALFASVGKVTRVSSVLAGGSTTYEIDFADAADARKAVSEFDKRPLDGRQMALALASTRPALFAKAIEALPKKKNEDKKKKKKAVVVDVAPTLNAMAPAKKTKKKTKNATPERVAPKAASRRRKSQ